jgi:hypothetical protein
MPKRIVCRQCDATSEHFEKAREQWIRCPSCRKEARVNDIQFEEIKRHIKAQNAPLVAEAGSGSGGLDESPDWLFAAW